MTGKPQRKDDSKKRLDPAILVALIGLIGTIIAASPTALTQPRLPPLE